MIFYTKLAQNHRDLYLLLEKIISKNTLQKGVRKTVVFCLAKSAGKIQAMGGTRIDIGSRLMGSLAYIVFYLGVDLNAPTYEASYATIMKIVTIKPTTGDIKTTTGQKVHQRFIKE